MNRLFGTHIPATALRAVPPTSAAFSSTTTLAPSSCACNAVVNPASAPPTTTMSTSMSQRTPAAGSGASTSGLPMTIAPSVFGEKVDDGAVVGFALLPLGPVPGIVDQFEPAAGDLLGHVEPGACRAGWVVARPDDERGAWYRGQVGVGDHVAAAHIWVLQAEDVTQRLGESRPGVDGPANGDQLVGDHCGVGHQPLEARPDPFLRRIVGGRLR